jgi:hypothetical protein
MKRSNEINASEISELIRSAANRLLGHHVGLVATSGQARRGIACLECGGQWMVVEAKGMNSRHGLDLMPTTNGDGYCEEGATNYFDSNGMVTHRV